jgi:hypothetical protein
MYLRNTFCFVYIIVSTPYESNNNNPYYLKSEKNLCEYDCVCVCVCVCVCLLYILTFGVGTFRPDCRHRTIFACGTGNRPLCIPTCVVVQLDELDLNKRMEVCTVDITNK